jgi:two-component system response regulator YesN
MTYKVFLVEDEIVAREGIRDNVDWKSAGFEFCGEAPDGEVALPLLEASQPEVVITDIKMPFMDGLQLCKIIREHMPWVKIIILSGHDEFHYAQTALKMGVTEYLLKPVSAQDLYDVLHRVAGLLDQEKKERESLKRLRDQVEDNLVLLRERFLLRLVTGAESSAAAIEQSQQLGLNIIAKGYLVMLINIELAENAQPFDYREYQGVEHLIASLVGSNPDAYLVKKDLEELVLIIKGDSPEQLEQEGDFLARLIQQEVEKKTTCRLAIGLGSPQQRLGDIHHSFAEALVKVNHNSHAASYLDPNGGADKIELLKLEQSALENYLKCGMEEDFGEFFDAYIHPLGEAALHSYLIKNYIFVDIVLTTAQFISDLGGDVERVIPEIHDLENLLTNAKTIDQIREQTRKIFSGALTFRDSQVYNEHAMVVNLAKSYIDNHSPDPDLSLNEVSAQVNLSPSHFSSVFSHETGETFRDYLTRMRIDRSKEMLRTTRMKCSQVAYESGYNDPHYFSFIFRKNTGLTPQQYRTQSQNNKKK